MILARVLSIFDKKGNSKQIILFRVFFMDWYYCTSFQNVCNIPDENDRLKREASWLAISLFKSMIILEGILFGPTVLWC